LHTEALYLYNYSLVVSMATNISIYYILSFIRLFLLFVLKEAEIILLLFFGAFGRLECHFYGWQGREGG